MSKVFSALAVSVDGYITGRDPGPVRGLGDGATLFDWYADVPSKVFDGFKLSEPGARVFDARSWSSAESKRFRSCSSRGWSMGSGSRSTGLRPVAAGHSSTVASQRWNSSFRRRVAIPQARSPSSTKTRVAPSEYRPGHRVRRPQATAGAVRTLPRPLMIFLNATIVNVVPPPIQEHLGCSRTRVAVGCAGSMPQ